jgi:magnesium-transporting ATPase (P-type)
LFANKYLIGAFFASALLQVAIVELPFLHPIMKTTYITGMEWAVILASLVVFFIAEETIGKKLGF